MYTTIYTDKVPILLEQLANTSEMQRLADIGMHCGCDYTKYQFYRKAGTPYSRLIHSIGVAKIVWNFTHDLRQAAAGLFHDIATPVFAHTIDFMQGDHMTQESTEDKTLSFIESSREITKLLKQYQIRIDEVSDYHKYPIADNDTPMLSADRLEYTIGNGFCVCNRELEALRGIYQDLIVVHNEYGNEELCFQTIEAARKFTEISLENSRFFVSDEDRFAMQYLAEIMRFALEKGVVLPEELYLTEREVIHKLNNDPSVSKMWRDYTELSAVSVSKEKPINQYSVNVSAKKRYIDPLVLSEDSPRRLSVVDTGMGEQIQAFLDTDFNQWIFAI